LPVIYKQDGKLTPVYVLVYDTLGGPVSLLDGPGIQQGRDIVIDQTLSLKYGLDDEAAFFMPFAFISYDGMIDLFLESEIAPDLSTFPLLSFLLVELSPQADRPGVQRRIEQRVPEVDVFTPTELAAHDVAMARTFYRPIMGLLVAWSCTPMFVPACAASPS